MLATMHTCMHVVFATHAECWPKAGWRTPEVGLVGDDERRHRQRARVGSRLRVAAARHKAAPRSHLVRPPPHARLRPVSMRNTGSLLRASCHVQPRACAHRCTLGCTLHMAGRVAVPNSDTEA